MTRRYFEAIVDTVRHPLVVLRSDLTVASANRRFYALFDVTPEQIEGCLIYDIVDGQWQMPALWGLLEDVLAHDDDAVEGFDVEHEFPRLGHRRMVFNARKVKDAGNETDLILLALEYAAGDEDVEPTESESNA